DPTPEVANKPSTSESADKSSSKENSPFFPEAVSKPITSKAGDEPSSKKSSPVLPDGFIEFSSPKSGDKSSPKEKTDFFPEAVGKPSTTKPSDKSSAQQKPATAPEANQKPSTTKPSDKSSPKQKPAPAPEASKKPSTTKPSDKSSAQQKPAPAPEASKKPSTTKPSDKSSPKQKPAPAPEASKKPSTTKPNAKSSTEQKPAPAPEANQKPSTTKPSDKSSTQEKPATAPEASKKPSTTKPSDKSSTEQKPATAPEASKKPLTNQSSVKKKPTATPEALKKPSTPNSASKAQPSPAALPSSKLSNPKSDVDSSLQEKPDLKPEILKKPSTSNTSPTSAPQKKPAPLSPENSQSDFPSKPTSEKKGDYITIKAVGDIVPGTNFPNYRLPDNNQILFEKVKASLKGADILFGNFESTLTNHSRCAKDTSRSMVFAFRTPPEYAKVLKNTGFNVLSVANNHSMDFSPVGFADTMKNIEKAGMKPVGKKNQIVYSNINNIPVAFIGFSHLDVHNSLNDLTAAKALVAKAKEKAKIVVISVHGGAEGTAAMRVKNRQEMFYGENRGNMVRFAHTLVDNGADLILGHGPHVARAMELYKGKMIAYSLGNFVGYRTLSTAGVLSNSLILEAKLNSQGDFLSGKIIPVSLDRQGIPHPDKQFRSVKMIANLTKSDFPNTLLSINKNGDIVKQFRTHRFFTLNFGVSTDSKPKA
ncbi:MAG TPA: CapA family protein, partial [Candidatus Obscuribacterales bacterium]